MIAPNKGDKFGERDGFGQPDFFPERGSVSRCTIGSSPEVPSSSGVLAVGKAAAGRRPRSGARLCEPLPVGQTCGHSQAQAVDLPASAPQLADPRFVSDFRPALAR